MKARTRAIFALACAAGCTGGVPSEGPGGASSEWAGRGSVRPLALPPPPSDIVVSTTGYPYSAPAIAWDGSNWLVVWEDLRNDDVFHGVYGARVSADGVLLDTDGIPISTRAEGEGSPTVAHDGSNYLVAWSDGRGTSADVYGARVSASGTVLDPDGVRISTSESDELNARVAGGASGWFVVWYEDRFTAGTHYESIRGARVGADGTVLDSSGLVLENEVIVRSGGFAPQVSFDGASFLAIWDRLGSGHGAVRVLPDGSIDGRFRVGTSGVSPAVSHDGSNWLVVWKQDSSNDIHGMRVAPTGSVLDSAPLRFTTGARYNEAIVHVVHDGSNFVIAHSGHPIGFHSGGRVTGDGVALDPSGFPIAPGGGSLAIASGDPGKLLVAFHSSGVLRALVFDTRCLDDTDSDGDGCAQGVGGEGGTTAQGGEGGDSVGVGGAGGTSGAGGGGRAGGGVSSEGGESGQAWTAGSAGVSGTRAGAGGTLSGEAGDEGGGRPGSGGATAGVPAGAGRGAASGVPTVSGDDGGCGCRIVTRRAGLPAWALVLAFGALIHARRRRGRFEPTPWIAGRS